MGEEKEIKKRKKFEGIVVSDKMEKTVVVKKQQERFWLGI